MSPEKLLAKIVNILERLEIPYMVTGGFAVSVWGRPRYTADIDIVFEMLPKRISQLAKELLSVDKDVYVSKEAMEEALERKGEFNFIHPETGLKVDFWIEKDRVASEFEKIKMERRIPKKINGQTVYFVSPEDLILSKLIWHKEGQSIRHLEDIKSVLRISQVDVDYLRRWAEQQNTLDVLEKLLKNHG